MGEEGATRGTRRAATPPELSRLWSRPGPEGRPHGHFLLKLGLGTSAPEGFPQCCLCKCMLMLTSSIYKQSSLLHVLLMVRERGEIFYNGENVLPGHREKVGGYSPPRLPNPKSITPPCPARLLGAAFIAHGLPRAWGSQPGPPRAAQSRARPARGCENPARGCAGGCSTAAGRGREVRAGPGALPRAEDKRGRASGGSGQPLGGRPAAEVTQLPFSACALTGKAWPVFPRLVPFGDLLRHGQNQKKQSFLPSEYIRA